MRFKAILIGAEVIPFGGGGRKPWQAFTATQHEAEQLGKGILETLTPDEQKEAYVKVVAITELLLAEIHTAAEKGPDGTMTFAIARHDGKTA